MLLLLLLSAALIGVGSAVFHPESSRIARMASAGKHRLAQSIFQVVCCGLHHCFGLSGHRRVWAGIDAGQNRCGVWAAFGLSFGIAGIGAAAIGTLADIYNLETVYRLCALLPLLGLVAFMLPEMRKRA